MAESNSELNYQSHEEIIPILGVADCSWCGLSLQKDEGITLKTCLHPFCMTCLTSLINSSNEAQIMCPVRDHNGEFNNNPQCSGYLTLKEIEFVLGPELFVLYREREMVNAQERMDSTAPAPATVNGFDEYGPYNKQAKAGPSTASARVPAEAVPTSSSNSGQHQQHGRTEQQPSSIPVTEKVKRILLADFPTTCGLCTVHLPVTYGIILQTCGCIFCKDCLMEAIINSTASRVTCPRPTASTQAKCDGYLLDQEVKTLVSEGRYEEYMGRSLREARNLIGNLFNCKTPNCQGCCEVDASSVRQVFLCPLCSKMNCLACQAIHEGVECAKYKEIVARATQATGKNSGPEFDAFLEEHMQPAGGFEQLATFVNQTGPGSSAMSTLERYKLIPTTKPFTCQICMDVIQPSSGTGVILQDCLHTFCKECLVSVITHSEEVRVQCPHRDPIDGGACSSFLSSREIQALVTAPVLDQHLQRSIQQAELTTPNSFHCATPNCTGWCVLEEDDVDAKEFFCPVCNQSTCIPCKARHPGLTCEYYQQSINDDLNKRVQAENERKGAALLEQELQSRVVMRCPRCQLLCQKISGCNSC